MVYPWASPNHIIEEAICRHSAVPMMMTSSAHTIKKHPGRDHLSSVWTTRYLQITSSVMWLGDGAHG